MDVSSAFLGEFKVNVQSVNSNLTESTKGSYIQGFTTRVSYNQGSYNQGFLQPGLLQPGVLTTRGSYNQGYYNQGFYN